jgi:nucleotide-binding universal stress UspA family protein
MERVTTAHSAVPRFVVLAALDGSPAEQEVARTGADLARAIEGGELHLIHVIEAVPPAISSVPPPPGLGQTMGEMVVAARKHLDGVVAEARARFGGRIVAHVAAGSARKQVLQLALDLQADLLLVGTHGRTGLRRMVLGSIAESVARGASCPVLVVRAKDYHSFVPPEIEPACPACLSAQRDTNGARLWCGNHSEGAPRGHISF